MTFPTPFRLTAPTPNPSSIVRINLPSPSAPTNLVRINLPTRTQHPTNLSYPCKAGNRSPTGGSNADANSWSSRRARCAPRRAGSKGPSTRGRARQSCTTKTGPVGSTKASGPLAGRRERWTVPDNYAVWANRWGVRESTGSSATAVYVCATPCFRCRSPLRTPRGDQASPLMEVLEKRKGSWR